MKRSTLTSATLMLVSVAFMAAEIITDNIVFWMLGMTFFVAVGFRLFDLESTDFEKHSLVERATKP